MDLEIWVSMVYYLGQVLMYVYRLSLFNSIIGVINPLRGSGVTEEQCAGLSYFCHSSSTGHDKLLNFLDFFQKS